MAAILADVQDRRRWLMAMPSQRREVGQFFLRQDPVNNMSKEVGQYLSRM